MSLEVWSWNAPGAEIMALFLSDAALTAASTVFAPVPVLDTCSAAALPTVRRLVIDGQAARAWGVDEAERLLR